MSSRRYSIQAGWVSLIFLMYLGVLEVIVEIRCER